MAKTKIILMYGLCIFFIFSSAFAKQWYEGGNLHQANALQWQTATQKNKLATCSDFIATMWTKKLLKPSIHSQINSMNDLRLFAEILVQNLDAAFKMESDPIRNKNMYANQTVNGTVALLMVFFGWIE